MRWRFRREPEKIFSGRRNPPRDVLIHVRFSISNLRARLYPSIPKSWFLTQGKEIDFRVATSPRLHGESVVLEIGELT